MIAAIVVINYTVACRYRPFSRRDAYMHAGTWELTRPSVNPFTRLKNEDAGEARNCYSAHNTVVAEWLACWRRRARVQIAVTTLSGNSLRQTAHTHRASVHQAAKMAAALLRVARVTAGLAESNGNLPPDL